MTETQADEQPSERAEEDAQGAVKAEQANLAISLEMLAGKNPASPPRTEQAGEATGTHLQGDEAGCSSGESNTRAKRSASATTTNYKDGSPSASRPGGGNGTGSGDGGSGHGSRAGSGNEDGPTSAKPRAAGKAGAAGKCNKRKLARPEGTAQCPRCESSDTKFCYYNNYNIKQPRYFCKACQRYWTAGGILRNVPVGAGRRKSKASAVREQEKAAAATAAKQARQVAAHSGAGGGGGPTGRMAVARGLSMSGGTDTGQQAQLMSAAGDLLPAGPLGGGPVPGFGAEQLRFMMDPCAQLAAGGMAGPGGAMMGGPGGMGALGFDGPAGYGAGFSPGAGMLLPPHAAGGMGGVRVGGDGGGLLPPGPDASLGADAVPRSGPAASGFSSGREAEDGGQADGRRVRTRLDSGSGHGGGSMSGGGNTGGIPASNSAGSLGRVLPDGGDDRHPEWAAAAQAAERQQAAAVAAQMAAQASMQQAAAMQAQAQLQGMAAAAHWGQPAAPFGMPAAGMWPSYPGMAAPSYGVGPNWAAAAQLNARFGNNGFGGAVSGSGDLTGATGAIKSPTLAGSALGDGAGGDLSSAPGMLGSGWNSMMPIGSAPLSFTSGWGMGADMGGGWGVPAVPHMNMPSGKHLGSMSGGGGPAASSLASGQSANTGLQPGPAAV